MGPPALFDKSFLQSLSVDESVLFDHFFIPAVCPIFYVETLADLEKAVREGRTPDKEVGIIAQKTPEMSGTPIVHHQGMGLSNLMGKAIPMTGQIPVAGGKAVEVEGQGGVIFGVPPEAQAFARWQIGQFLDVERMFAKEWRANLQSIDLSAIAAGMNAVGIDAKTCRTLEDAKRLADSFVEGNHRKFDRLRLAASLLGLPVRYERSLLQRWSVFGEPPLREYAPFAAHVVNVELFFRIALGAGLISSEDANNRTDIGYLFYLPFCMMFVSSDKLHKRCASLFLREDQKFVWGHELKAGLKEIHRQMIQLAEEEREKGLFKIAAVPPKDSFVDQVWLSLFKKPRTAELPNVPRAGVSRENWTAADLKLFADAPALEDHEINFNVQDPSLLSIQRNI